MIALLLAGGVALRVETVRADPAPTHLVVRDVTGDGRADLVAAEPDALVVRAQGERGFAAEPSGRIARPAAATLFDVADLDGDGVHEIVLLESGRAVRSVRIGADGKPGSPTTLVEAAGANAPPGLHRARLVRDLDGDGDGDLVLPGNGDVVLFVRGKDGAYAAAGSVAADVRVNLEVGDPRVVTARDLREKFESKWEVPLFELSDVNGDGRKDLVAQTDASVLFTLARADGSFPAEPSFRLDLERWKKTLPKDPSGRSLDPRNVFATIGNRVEWHREDLDGDGATDFVVRAGGVITVWRGGAGGVDFAAPPAQVLKTSGNVLGILLLDDDGDGREDLAIARVEDVSWGEVFQALLTSVRVSVDVFVYRNREGKAFSARPDRRQRFTIVVPSIRHLRKEEDRLRAEVAKDSLAARGDFDGDGTRDDLLLVQPDRAIEVYADGAAGTAIGETRTLLSFLRDLGWGSAADEVEITIDQVLGFAGRERETVRKLRASRRPDWEAPPPEGTDRLGEGNPSVWVFDLDGDRRDDALVGWETPGMGRDRPFFATALFSSGGRTGAAPR